MIFFSYIYTDIISITPINTEILGFKIFFDINTPLNTLKIDKIRPKGTVIKTASAYLMFKFLYSLRYDLKKEFDQLTQFKHYFLLFFYYYIRVHIAC